MEAPLPAKNELRVLAVANCELTPFEEAGENVSMCGDLNKLILHPVLEIVLKMGKSN